MNNFKLENWLPQEPWQGPPLPEFLSIYWPWYKPPVPGEGAELKLEIIGPGSIPVLGNSPVTVLEGESYTVRATVTNLTTKAGQPWEATLTLRVVANIAGELFLGPIVSDEYFAPGQTLAFEYPMTIPLGKGGLSGTVIAIVTDPANKQLAYASEPLAVETVEITYGAEVVIGV